MGRRTHERAVLGGWRVQNRSETQEGEERVEQMTPISVSKDRLGGQLSSYGYILAYSPCLRRIYKMRD